MGILLGLLGALIVVGVTGFGRIIWRTFRIQIGLPHDERITRGIGLDPDRKFYTTPISFISDMFWCDVFLSLDFDTRAEKDAKALPGNIKAYMKTIPNRVITSPSRFWTWINTDTVFDAEEFFKDQQNEV